MNPKGNRFYFLTPLRTSGRQDPCESSVGLDLQREESVARDQTLGLSKVRNVCVCVWGGGP